MSSKSIISADNIDVIQPSQHENTPLTIHIGVFWGGDNTIQGTWLASNYEIKEDESNRKYTIVFPNSISPSLEELFEEDGMESFGNRVGEMLYEVFNRLHGILSGYFSQASNLAIEIDTFCIEEGFFCASMFCETIEHGCFDNLPPYAEYALNYCGGCGILEDMRMRGAKVTLNSFTTFQTMPDASPQEKKFSLREKESDTIHPKKSKDSRRSRMHSEQPSYDVNQYKKGAEYITANEDLTSFKISIQKARYEGLYSKLCNVEEWLENTALACDIVALSCAVTGIGVVVGGVCEVTSMGLNGINVVVCFALAGMAAVDRNTETINEHLLDAGFNTIGALPFGSIIGKTMKGAKFITRKEAIRLVEGTADTASKDNKIARLYPAKPNLKVVDSKSPNIEQSSSEMTNIKQIRPQLIVINGGKNEGKWVKVANGSEVFIPQVTNTSNHVILDSIEDLSSYNNIFVNIEKSSRLGTDAVQSTNNIDALKDNSVFTQDSSTDIVEEVKEVSKVPKVVYNEKEFEGMQRAIDKIKSYKIGRKFLAKIFVYFHNIEKLPPEIQNRLLEIIKG